jgi:hypothetical protein
MHLAWHLITPRQPHANSSAAVRWRASMAAKGKENRIIITLACTECKERNYTTTKNRRTIPTAWS